MDELRDKIIIWYNEFSTFINHQMPLLNGILFDIKEDNNINAKVQIQELELKKYIIHVNKRMINYLDNYNKAILFHEFTHIYDYLTCPPNINKKTFLNSYSECHASSIELSILLSINYRQTVFFDQEQIVAWEDTKKPLIDIVFMKSANAQKNLESLDIDNISKNPLTSLCYYLGYLKVFSNGIFVLKKEVELYKKPFDKLVIKFAQQYWGNNKNGVIKTYENMENQRLQMICDFYKVPIEKVNINKT